MLGRIFSIVLAFFFLLGSVSFANAQGENGAFQIDAAVSLRAFEALISARISGDLTALRTLAATEDAQSGDWDRIKEPLSRFSRSSEDSAAVWFARPDGSYFTVSDGLTNQNLKDREYFPALMEGRDAEGELVTSRSTGRKSVIIAVPVMKNGKVIGALGVSLSVETLAAWIDDRLTLPAGVIFYALDSKGQTALHRERELMFAYPSQLGDKSLQDAVQTMLTQPSGVVRYTFRGSSRTVIFRHSDQTSWIFALGIVEPALGGSRD